MEWRRHGDGNPSPKGQASMRRDVVFSVHATKRMFERSISVDDVICVLQSGEEIEDYPNDWPYPSRLLLGWRNGQPLHVVVAENAAADGLVVVTLYEPDPAKWDSEFKRRML